MKQAFSKTFSCYWWQHWTASQPRYCSVARYQGPSSSHWCRVWCYCGWTTAMQCWLAFDYSLHSACNKWWKRPYDSSSQLSCLTIFSTSLSVAAFLHRAGGSMLESTGSHGRGVERRVPEMRRMVEFNCTSIWLVWAERDQTGAQYSAAE